VVLQGQSHHRHYSHTRESTAMDLVWAGLHARLNRLDDVRRIVTRDGSHLRTYPPTYALLVRHNMTNEIPGYLKSRIRSMSFAGSYPNLHGMRPGEREVAAKVVADIQDPDLRLAAGALFAAVPNHDPALFAWRGVKSADALILEQADALRKHAFADKRLRDQALTALLRGPGMDALAAEAVAMFADTKSLSRAKSALFERYLEHLLAKGRNDAYLQLYKTLAADGPAEKKAGDAHGKMLSNMTSELRSYLVSSKPGSKETWASPADDYLALCTQMLADATPDTKQHRSLFVLRYCLHGILGEEKAAGDWLAQWRKLDPDFEHSQTRAWVLRTLYGHAVKQAQGETRKAIAKRFADLFASELIKEIVYERHHEEIPKTAKEFDKAVKEMDDAPDV